MKAKAALKEDTCIKYYDETRHHLLETDGFGFGLGADLLQIRDRMNCPQGEASYNSILRPIAPPEENVNMEKRYSSIRREAFMTLYWVEKFHYYYFAKEVSFIMEYKPLVVILKIQYRIQILYKPEEDLFIEDWLSWQNHEENQEREVPWMKIKHWYHRDSNRHPRMFFSTRYTASNTPRFKHATAKRIHHTWMASQQKWNYPRKVFCVFFLF